MGRLVTRADLGVAASLAARRLFRRHRLPTCGSVPMWLSFVVGLAVGHAFRVQFDIGGVGPDLDRSAAARPVVPRRFCGGAAAAPITS